MSKSEEIKARLEQQGIRYWAGDNIPAASDARSSASTGREC